MFYQVMDTAVRTDQEQLARRNSDTVTITQQLACWTVRADIVHEVSVTISGISALLCPCVMMRQYIAITDLNVVKRQEQHSIVYFPFSPNTPLNLQTPFITL